MTAPIPPALTPDEWAKRERRALRRDGRHINVGVNADGVFWINTYMGASPPDLPALVALANAARADDDPGKITHADVEALRSYSRILAARGARDPSLSAIAAKLAAILPPETP